MVQVLHVITLQPGLQLAYGKYSGRTSDAVAGLNCCPVEGPVIICNYSARELRPATPCQLHFSEVAE